MALVPGYVTGLLAVAAVVSSLCGCSRDSASAVGRLVAPIIGGTAASSSDFPQVVAVSVNGAKLCGGVLITPTKVLSAAHCVDPDKLGLADLSAVASATSVYVGITDFNAVIGPGAEVASIYLHPSYAAPLKDHDLSVIELKSAVEIAPAPINVDSSLDASNTTLTLVGYGVTSAPGGTPDQSTSGVLRSLRSRTKSCASIAFDRMTSLCFDQSSVGGSCFDDGGPSFLEVAGTRFVVGIHSFTDPSCNQYSLDTRVDQELSFIAPLLCAADGYCAAMCGTASGVADPDCTANLDAGAANDAAVSAGGRGGAPDAADSSVAGTTDAGEGAAGSARATSTASSDAGSTPTSTHGSQSGAGGMSSASALSGSGCGCRLAPHASHADRASYTALAALCVAVASKRRQRAHQLRG